MKNDSTQPLVSVIISVLNEGAGIAETIESILLQTHSNFELIVVDGGSTDPTLSILEKYPIKIIHAPGTTPGMARNIGIRAARGETVAITDGDCVPTVDWLSNAQKYLSDPQVGGVGGPITAYPGSKPLSRNILDSLSTGFGNGGSRNFSRDQRVKEVDNIPSLNAIYNKQIVIEAGLFPENLRYCEDLALNTRILEKGYRLVSCPDIIVQHNWKVNSLKSLAKFMYSYGAGRAKAAKMNQVKDRNILILVYPTLILALAAALNSPTAFTITSILALLYATASMANAAYIALRTGKTTLFILTPAVTTITHACYAGGYFVESLKRVWT